MRSWIISTAIVLLGFVLAILFLVVLENCEKFRKALLVLMYIALATIMLLFMVFIVHETFFTLL